MSSNEIPFKVGESVTFSKTLGETDVYTFAGITGDFDPIHINKNYAEQTEFGERIAHGMLSLSLSSTTSSMMSNKTELTTVSYGYDRIRFVKPVYIGDTLTVTYTISEKIEKEMKTISKIEIVNQNDEVCVVANHIMKYLK